MRHPISVNHVSVGNRSICLSDIESVRSIEPEEATSVATDAVFRENRSSLFRLKLAFVTTLVAVAATVGFCAYYFASEREKKGFHRSFAEDANILIRHYNISMLDSRVTAVALTYDFTIAVDKVTDESWPYVTLNEFEALAFSKLYQSRVADMAFFAPIVPYGDRRPWEKYAASARPLDNDISPSGNRSVADGIYLVDAGVPLDDNNSTQIPYVPVWHVSPTSSEKEYLMFNQASDYKLGGALRSMLFSKSATTSPIFLSELGVPQFMVFTPVFNGPAKTNVVASISLRSNVAKLFQAELPTREKSSIMAVVTSMCGQEYPYTFHLHTDVSDPFVLTADFVGDGDLHDAAYDMREVAFLAHEQDKIWESFLSEAPTDFQELIRPSIIDDVFENAQYCGFNLRLYPTVQYEAAIRTRYPLNLAVGTSMAIVVSTLLFLAYNYFAERLQGRVLLQTKRKSDINGALVKSFFPSVVRERVVGSSKTFRSSSNATTISNISKRSKTELGPIAEQFPLVTVIFADIAGFTAWSSQRDPEAVFALLETIFEKFDTLARRLGVFKVETIGDCYMAVCGLPKPNRDHAIVAARFAYECLSVMRETTRELEAQLGPGTANLQLRLGLHSGSVTGGVLRGEKARFQLFGDTVNTAARMEQNGIPGRVQVSQATADLIVGSGKQHWLIPRKELVLAKGKGALQVYFVQPRRLRNPSRLSSRQNGLYSSLDFDESDKSLFQSVELISDIDASMYSMSATTLATSLIVDRDVRLIDWNAELLLHCLLNSQETQYHVGASSYGKLYVEYQGTVRPQLRSFVCYLSTLFTDKPYHNFEHASISAMFANKLMKQASRRLSEEYHDNKEYDTLIPVLRFAVVLSALVRDIQCGQRTIKGFDELTSMILDLLRTPDYDALYFALCNAAVDDRTFTFAFSECIKASAILVSDEMRSTRVPLARDTGIPIPIEMLSIVRLVSMSSAVGHWMQHWNVFSIWHGRLFQEMQGNCCGCTPENHPQKWCDDEATFFEHSIIPLATELVECKLGLDYAERAEENYREWQAHGLRITETLILPSPCISLTPVTCQDCVSASDSSESECY